MAKLTLDDLIERKQKTAAVRRDIYVPCLGGELTAEKIPLRRFLAMTEGVDAGNSVQSLDFNVELIYACVPAFHDKKLQEAYDCTEPSDIVLKIFDDNMGAMNALAGEIIGFYGLGDEVENLKN